MNVIAWIVFGLIVGVIANLIDPRPAQGGIIGAIILGIVGALVGGFIGNLLFGVPVTGFNFPSFIVAVIGSIIVLWIARAFYRRSEP
jgi:uncharacterized membrane protein YeaQ/YmgE (transglycosylase-associated protein family)